jgi:hypothetical protein
MDILYQARVKQDRDAAFLSYTRSICPVCKKLIDAHLVLRADKIFMQKKCPQHGYVEVEISKVVDPAADAFTVAAASTSIAAVCMVFGDGAAFESKRSGSIVEQASAESVAPIAAVAAIAA